MGNTEFNLKPKQELLNDVKEFYEKDVLPFLSDYDKKRGKGIGIECWGNARAYIHKRIRQIS